MTEIPDDIRKAAPSVYAGYVNDVKSRYAPNSEDIEELVTLHAARAILAERERCAKIADDYECELVEYPGEDAKNHYVAGSIDAAIGIAAAIRGGA